MAEQGLRFKFGVYDIVIYSFCILFAFMCFYPMWYVFIGSISPYDTFSSEKIKFIPTSIPSLRYYEDIVRGQLFQQAFIISILKTVLGTVFTMALTSTMAYGVSKSNVKGMKFINIYVVFTMYFGGTLIQHYLLYNSLKMINTFWVMVIPSIVDTWIFIIMRNYFANNIPAELEQAAAIDGANDIYLFFRIVIPISRPIFAAMALFVAVGHWNDFITYTFYCQDVKLQPFVKLLQKLLINPNTYIAQGGGDTVQNMNKLTTPPMALKYTTIMCAMIPIMAVYPFLQKHFAKGILIGAVKE